MAYNPFNIFRRNQKALFAVLTVFIMIMFTLSFGRGDFFERIPYWLGGNRGEAVCKIDGHDVTTKELHGAMALDFQRRMANKFMALAANESVRTLREMAREQHATASSESAKKNADLAMQVAAFWLSGQLQIGDIMQMPFLVNMMDETLDSPTAKADEKEIARTAKTLYLLIQKIAMGGNSHYFVNAPNRNDRDLIDFLLWKRKADQLGISFTTEDTKKLIQTEFNNAFKNDVPVRQAMKDVQGFTYEACIDAIAVEFKVRAAQTAVLGQLGRVYRAPAYSTPYEAYEYYRDECSPTTYEAIGVPVAAFIPQVQGEPTEEERKALYDKYQNDEPNPKNETPGFKDPRKVSIGWLAITGEEPYYKKLAEEQIRIGEKMAIASGALTTPLPGALNFWAAAVAGPLSLKDKDPAVDAAYNNYSKTFEADVYREYGSSRVPAQYLLPTSVVKPGVLMATLGGFVGQTAGMGSPITALSVSMAAPYNYEIRDRAKVGLPYILSTIPSPGMLPTTLGGIASYRANEPKPLPADVMRPELIKEAIAARAKTLAFGGRSADPSQPGEKGDIQRFIEEVNKLSENGRAKDKTAVEKYIQEFITSRGLKQSGKMTAPRDEWSIEEDPALQPLVQTYKDEQKSRQTPTMFGDMGFTPFGQVFFWNRDFDRATFRPKRGSASLALYAPQEFEFNSRQADKPQYYFWRTEDIQPKKTLNRDTAKDAVTVAWRRIKARELAQNYANSLADRIRAYDKTDPISINQFLRDQAAAIPGAKTNPKIEARVEPFTINDVSPLVMEPSFDFQTGRSRTNIRAYELRDSAKIPYPTAEMKNALLDNRDKPVKTVLVLPDAPKDTFYVATLKQRFVKSPEDFRVDVFSRFGRAQEIRNRFVNEETKKSRQSVVDLLKKEFKYEETEEQKKRLDENAKSNNREE